MKKILLVLLCLVATVSQGQIEGYWKGKLNAGFQQLEVGFDIKSDGMGWASTFDVPAQGGFDIPVEETIFEEGHLRLKMSSFGATYEGTLEGDSIKGDFTQMGMSFALNLARGEKETKKGRPQDPKAPFGYRIEEVSFNNVRDNITLAGTLTMPEGEGPFPALVLVSGSGQQNRDEELMNHRPFWVIADYLTRHGIAVLRYDDRGVGGSGGDAENATTLDFSYDAEAAFDYLLSLPKVNPSRIGILGHSEGGLINFMVAARRPEVGFLISLAGPSVCGKDVLMEQEKAFNRASGMPEEAVDMSAQMNKQLYDVVLASDNAEAAADSLRKVLPGMGMNDALIDQIVNPISTPWMYYFLKYDPTDAIVKVSCPALLLNGSKDVQVLVNQNFDGYNKIIQEYGKTNLTLVEMPGLNHLFQHCETGLPQEYANIEETISPEVLQKMVDFIK